jgi:uncharacterized membrane-anchored protein
MQTAHRTTRERSWSAKKALVKVPEITAIFWLIKVLTTGMGESASDFVAQRSLWLSAAVGGAALAGALWMQFRRPSYHAPTYWFAVAMVAVFGTVIADVFNPQAGGFVDVSLPKIAGGYAIALAVCFAAWYRTEGTLSIHSITTPRREAFYWATVMLTFALGTAAGDWTAFYLDLGFATSMGYFAVAIVIPWLLWRFARLNSVAAFWMAYVLTRPLGASIADWLGKDKPLGLGVGDGKVTLAAAALVTLLVTYLWRTGADVQRSDEVLPSPAVS